MNHMNKETLINDIITQNRNYAKEKTALKVKVAILNTNISLSELIYIDTISRVLSLKTTIDNDYLINSHTKYQTTAILDQYRVYFNNLLPIAKLNDNIETLLNIITTSGYCSIIDNSLYFENHKLVMDDGNYTDYLRKINYLYTVSPQYDKIYIYDDNSLEYTDILKLLHINNVEVITLPDLPSVPNFENIDDLRIKSLKLEITKEEIETIFKNINKLLSLSSTISANYEKLDTNIENNLITLLYNYNNIILKVVTTLNLNILKKYIVNIINTSNSYLQILENHKLQEEQINDLKALKIILTNSLDLLGIIPIYL